jgi:hypothetical protein
MYEPVWHGGQAAIALMMLSELPEVQSATPLATNLDRSAGMWVQWVLDNLETDPAVLGRVKSTFGTSTVLEGLAALYAWEVHTAAGGHTHPSAASHTTDQTNAVAAPSGAAAALAATRAAQWFKDNAWQQGNGTLVDFFNLTTRKWYPNKQQPGDLVDGTVSLFLEFQFGVLEDVVGSHACLA